MNNKRKIPQLNVCIGLLASTTMMLIQPAIALDTAFFEALQSEKVVSDKNVEWTGASPANAGYLDQFWTHPTDSNALFQYPDLDAAYGTWNKGERWFAIQDSDVDGLQMNSVTSMDFSHQNPDLGFAIARQGVFITQNRGKTWTLLSTPPTENRPKHNIIAVDPSNDNNLFIGAGQSSLLKFTHVTKSGVDRLLERNHSSGFILKSTDQGRNWQLISSPFPSDTDVNNIIVDPRNSNMVYASTQYGVYISDDAGTTWEKSAGVGLPHNKPRDMDSYYNSLTGEFYLYIVEQTHYEQEGSSVKTTGGVFKSLDGQSWSNLTGNLAIDMSQINQTEYRERYYRAVAHWLEVPNSTVINNFGDMPTSTFSQYSGIEVDPTDPDRVYIVHNPKHDFSFPPGNIWMTEDAGNTWIAVAREGQYWINGVDKAYWDSRNQPSGMNATFTHVEPEHRTQDFGQSGPRFLETAPNGDLYSSFSQQTVRSTDRGLTWLQIDDIETSPGSKSWVGRGNTNMPGETILTNTGIAGEVLLGSGEHGLWRVQDDGDLAYPGAIAMKQLAGQSNTDYTGLFRDRQPLSMSAIATHPLFPERIYTLHFRQTQFGRMRFSNDGGLTWATLSTPITIPRGVNALRQHTLLIDPVNPDNMMFTVPITENNWFNGTRSSKNGGPNFNEYGIYQSFDGGLTWAISPANGIPAGKSIIYLARDKSNPSIIYAAANLTHQQEEGGLYRSNDNGLTWDVVTLPTNVTSVHEVRVHPKSGNVYIAAGSWARNDGGQGGAYVSKDGGLTWELIFDMPKVYHIAPSPIDENIIMAVVHPSQKSRRSNPGAYASVDGGATWTKVNANNGLSQRIQTLEADSGDARTFWTGLYAAGFFKIDLSSLTQLAPGKVQAEHYSAAKDNSLVNTGGDYRLEESVDIISSADANGGYQVTNIETGEWLEFDVQFKRSSEYQLLVRAAGAQGKFNLAIDGVTVLTEAELPASSNNQEFIDPLYRLGVVTSGSHTIRMTALEGGFELNFLEFVDVNQSDDIAVTGVALSTEQQTLSEGETFDLLATVLPLGATNQNVTFNSSNTAVASVSSSGLISANAQGQATISVTTEEGDFTAQTIIDVEALVEGSVSLDDINFYRNGRFVVGQTLDITANFEAGTGNTVVGAPLGGIRFFLRQIEPPFRVVRGKDIIVNAGSAIGEQTGQVNVSIPLTDITATADLPDGNFYFLFVLFESSDGTRHNVALRDITIVKAGDLDGNGTLDRTDASIFRAVMGSVRGSELFNAAADMDNDGTITRNDYSLFIKAIRNQ